MEDPSAAEAITMLIPVVAITLGIGFVMLSTFLDYRRKSEALKLYHAERMAAIEKGLELPAPPPELYQSFRRPPSPALRRRWAWILILVGIVIFAALGGFRDLATGGGEMWSGKDGALWGLMPTAVGIAHFIADFWEARAQRLHGGTPPGPDQGGPSSPR